MVSATHVFVLLLLSLLQAVSSSRFKIALPADEDFASRFARASRAACEDYSVVDDPENLVYPPGFEMLRRPWVDNPAATAGKSVTVTAGINQFYTLKVPGLNGQTIDEVLEVLRNNSCLSFPFGGPIRDQFLDAPPVDLDMETNCDADTMYAICVKEWGVPNCPRSSPTSPIVHIGSSEATDGETEILDTANWNSTFFGTGVNLEYTTNSMTYFADGVDIVIDLTGNGVNDTCNKLIRIPVATSDFGQWVSTNKVYRFWKLRIKEYNAANPETMNYIVSEAKKRINDDPDEFKSFYCKTVLDGKLKSSKCEILKKDCEGGVSKKPKYDAAFEKDLGAVWNDTAKALVDGLECNSCSDVCDTCNTGSNTGAVSTLVQATVLVLSIMFGAIANCCLS